MEIRTKYQNRMIDRVGLDYTIKIESIVTFCLDRNTDYREGNCRKKVRMDSSLYYNTAKKILRKRDLWWKVRSDYTDKTAGEEFAWNRAVERGCQCGFKWKD